MSAFEPGPGLTSRPDAGGVPVDVPALVRRLSEASATVATAESLTGGLVVAALVQVAGASAVVRGGIVAYHSDLKARLLGVDDSLLARGGAVQAEVAAQLAEGARDRLRATHGIGTTGVAGPLASDGAAPGTVFVAVAHAGETVVQRWAFRGDRDEVRRASTQAALRLLASTIGPPRRGAPGPVLAG